MPKCAGRMANGRVKKGYKVVAGKACPQKVGKRRKSGSRSRKVTEAVPKRSPHKHCMGLYTSGKKKGKLKKGWKFTKAGTCPRKVRKS